MKINKSSIFFLAFIFIHIFLKPLLSFIWVNNNILTRLDDVTEKKTHLRQKPVIGYFSLDIKFDGEHIKICEIGNGLFNVPTGGHDLKGHYAIINNIKEVLYTPYWDVFWHYLYRFEKPIFFIGQQDDRNKRVRGLSVLESFGPNVFYKKDNLKNKASRFGVAENLTQIASYDGIMVYIENHNVKKVAALAKHYPSLLMVNPFIALFERQKYNIHKFLKNSSLNYVRPLCEQYEKNNAYEYSNDIQQKFTSDLIVIKPDHGHQSMGIFLIKKSDLKSTLKKLRNNNSENIWIQNNKIVIEEFVQSKIVYHDGKPYDPTLRATFVACYEGDTIKTTLLSAFWKFPPASLDDKKASLRDKHITQSMSACDDIAPAMSKQDMDVFKQKFDQIAPLLFEKMIEGSEQF